MAETAGSSSYDADVIIAGAGPAGAAAATHLARLGASVLLLDRMTFPRDKVCGDFVGPSALIELDALCVSQMDGFAQTNIGWRGAIYVGGEELIARPFPAIDAMPPYGRVIPRLVLDKLILDAARSAGARVMEGCELIHFAAARDAAAVECANSHGRLNLRCRLLIGADGASSKAARLMRGSAAPRRDRFVASRAYFSNVAGAQEQLDLYFDAACLPGYYWLFPTGKGEANVGLGVAVESLPPHGLAPAATLRRLIREDNALASRLRKARLRGRIAGWPLITYNHRLPVISSRAMLIGDAAGLINPLNGEGIQYALQSARWAAEALVPCLRADDFSAAALAPFAARVEAELRYDMALARLLVQLISNRALAPLWIKVFKILAARARKDGSFADTLAGIFAGLLPARDALKLLGGTAGEAARAFAAALADPRALAALGSGTAQIGFRFGWDAANDPAGFALWLQGASASMAEFGARAVRSALSGRKKDAFPCSKAHPDGVQSSLALSDRMESSDRQEIAQIQIVSEHALIEKAGQLEDSNSGCS